MLAWLEEDIEHEFSDIDDEDEDLTFEPATQHVEDDVISYQENPEPNLEAQQDLPVVAERQRYTDESQQQYTGKNGFIRSKQERPYNNNLFWRLLGTLV